MKQMLLVLFAACSMLVQAQTLLLNDFETDTIGTVNPEGIKAAWSGSVIVAANPLVNALNASSKVLNVTNSAWVPVTIPVTLPAGKTWADYDGVRIKLCPTAGDDLSYAQIELGLAENSWSEFKVGATSVWSSATLNTWYSADIAFDQTLLKSFTDTVTLPVTNLIVKYNKGAGYNILFDDIQLIEHQDPAREVKVDFEDQVLGSSAGMGYWYASGGSFGFEVITNPVTTGINTSSKALKVTYPASGGAIAMNILPANGDWHNYDNVSFKVLALAYDTPSPWSEVFVGGGPDTWTGGTDQSNTNFGVAELNTWYSVTVPIVSIKNSTQPYLNIQANGGVIYVLDDVSLNYASSEVKTTQASTLKIERISTGQYQISIGSQSAYSLINLEGRVIKSGTLIAGSNLLNVADLASGIYLLKTTSNSEKNIMKIIR
jgi:hypothetical protein